MKVATGTIASTDPAAEARRIAQLLEPSRDAMAGEPLPRTVGSDRTNVPLTPEHQSPVRDNADEVIVEFTDGSLMRLTPSPGQIRVETQVPDDVNLDAFQTELATRLGLPVSWQRS